MPWKCCEPKWVFQTAKVALKRLKALKYIFMSTWILPCPWLQFNIFDCHPPNSNFCILNHIKHGYETYTEIDVASATF